ncbi:IS66 family transposase, partial [Thiolapillus sp.]|uniref:IS66 family transposase n=1 Tax=Thiolapillus sp. TaxID=2017437 RepID=UPI003AF45477
VIRGGPPDRPAVLFEYDPSRSEEVPLRLLDGFRGTLQTDGYAGYNRVCRENGLTRIGCWDHARRKFVEASQAAPAKKKGKRVFGLVIDFGTSQSPKSTRPLTTHWCPSRPGHQALRNNFASSLLLRTWLPMTGRRVRRPTLFSLWRKARRENSAASRLLGSTSLRFALHGWQRSAQSDKWMWVIRGGPPDRPAVLFEYDPSRSEEVPLRLLDG